MTKPIPPKEIEIINEELTADERFKLLQEEYEAYIREWTKNPSAFDEESSHKYYGL